ncbi:MAG: RNA-binding protein [Thermoprotei archaeon]|nr:MAG: RNA-binding protein [Thermoprotei archaeon]
MPIRVSNGQIVVPGELVAEGRCEVLGPHFSSGRRHYAKVLSVAVVEKPRRVRLIPLKRSYVPVEGDIVIGKVVDIGPTSWVIDINSPYMALLQVSEVFPRPTTLQRDLSKILKVGDVVIAKVLSFDFAHDPLLTIKESKLGKVSKGLLVEIPPSRVSRIIGRKGQVVNYLRDVLDVELVVGRNGRVLVVGEDSEREAVAAYVIKRLCEEAYVPDPLATAKQLVEEALSSRGDVGGRG